MFSLPGAEPNTDNRLLPGERAVGFLGSVLVLVQAKTHATNDRKLALLMLMSIGEKAVAVVICGCGGDWG